MTSGVAPAPSSDKKQLRKQTSRGSNNSNTKQPSDTAAEIDDDIIKSISQKVAALHQPQVTVTCYIPTHCIGAVIGRRGSTIAQIQRHAQQVSAGGGPVRVSIVGHDLEEQENSSVPYTYSELDWSNPDWTPVVIRADPCAALAAAQRLHDMVDEMDDVVMDVPLSRNKHAALIGKRGLVLANLSADTAVRIMVPRRELRHDVIQLEGELQNVKLCLDRVLTIASDARSAAPPVRKNSRAEDIASTIILSQLPSQAKLRSVGRKTDTIIKKKKVDDEWHLTVTGSVQEQVQSAVNMLQKWNEDSDTPNRGPRNNNRGGRGPPRNNKINNDKSPKGKASKPPGRQDQATS